MPFDDLRRLLEDLRADVRIGEWIPTESERELARQVVATAKTLPRPADPVTASVISQALREGVRAAGPEVAPPAGERRWATAAVHCAAVLEAQRVAGSPEGQDLTRLLLELCPAIENALPYRPCMACVEIAHGWRSVVGDAPISHTERSSARALFGLHVQSAHPAAPAPGPDLVDCADCCHLVTYVTYSGDDVEVEGACSMSGDDTLRQHLLGHLIDRVPVPD